LVIATINIDAMIALIKSAENPEDAKNKMMAKQWEAGEALPFLRLVEEGSKAQAMLAQYKVSEEQAKAILDLRLHRLTALEKNKLGDEMKELAEDIKKYRQLLQDGESRKKLMVEEFEQSLKEFATPRRTEIVAEQGEQDITELIEKEDMVVSVTFGGYIKRVGLSSYRTQKRGGKGKVGMVTKEDDFVWKIFIANTHTDMLFFSSMGRCYKLKVFEIPESSPAGKGKALVNILPLAVRERITTVLALPEADQWENKYMIFATASGYVRRNLLSDFADERKAGKVAMKLDDGDSLVGVAVCDDGQDIFLATEQSRAIRFAISRKTEDGDEKGVRVFSGRASNGVSAVKLATGDKVVAMEVMNRGEEDSERRDSYLAVANAVARLKDKTYAASGSEEALRDKKKVADFDKDIFHKMKEEEQFMLTVNDMGMGQLCSSYDYRTTGRGGQGISNMASDGKIIDAFLIAPQDDEIMLITDSGQTIRLATKSMRKVGRNSKGIKLASLGEGQKIASVAHVSDAVSDDKENDDKE
ncbi:MAG: DNA gyrase subunit A, partial [Alphaproteobacteria bacterium]|nr:DNA gyrase subunit A [Alphaproteobacteria bacterium]